MVNVLQNSGPSDNYDNTNFNRLFKTVDSPKFKTNLLRNLSPKDLNIFQDELIVGDSDKYKFNKDTSGRLFELEQRDQDNNRYFDMIDKAVDKSYSKVAGFFTQCPSNLIDEYVVNDNHSNAWVSRNIDGEYQSMTNEPSVIRKNVATCFNNLDGIYNPQITYDIRDYHGHPEQLDYKEIPIMRKCFGALLRKSDVELMQDNITEIMSKECERRDAILESNPDKATRDLACKYHNSRVVDMMCDVCAMSAVYQVEGQAYVFDKDFINSMGPVYADISSGLDKKLGLDERSFENLLDYARVKQNAGYRYNVVQKAVIKDGVLESTKEHPRKDLLDIEYLTERKINVARGEWEELMDETEDFYGDLYEGSEDFYGDFYEDFYEEAETKAKAGPLPDLSDLSDHDSSNIHQKAETKNRPLPKLPDDWTTGHQGDEESFDY